eukprot:Selendium_serpulae@DN11543_c0_g1_i1.p2
MSLPKHEVDTEKRQKKISYDGMRPLHYAAEQQSRESKQCVFALLKGGAHIDAEDKLGRTPLMVAAYYGSLRSLNVVKALLLKHTNKHKRDKKGRTALHVAAARNNDLGVLYLLHSGSNPQDRDIDGNTALHLAAVFHAAKAMLTLVKDPRCDVNAINARHQTPLHLAAAPTEYSTEPPSSVSGNAILTLLNHGAVRAPLDYDKDTPLHYAAAGGYTEIVNRLLYNGKVALEVQDTDGHSALDIARAKGHTDISDILTKLTDTASRHRNHFQNNFEI